MLPRGACVPVSTCAGAVLRAVCVSTCVGALPCLLCTGRSHVCVSPLFTQPLAQRPGSLRVSVRTMPSPLPHPGPPPSLEAGSPLPVGGVWREECSAREGSSRRCAKVPSAWLPLPASTGQVRWSRVGDNEVHSTGSALSLHAQGPASTWPREIQQMPPLKA